jgi:D-arabinose 1-dehydrogenase-like Zn-dependent alcohol dehydrogenase
MLAKRLSVKGWPAGQAKDSEETIEFARFAGIKSHVERYPLSKADEAIGDMLASKVRFRAVIVP